MKITNLTSLKINLFLNQIVAPIISTIELQYKGYGLFENNKTVFCISKYRVPVYLKFAFLYVFHQEVVKRLGMQLSK